jgi:hypothetical protein
LCQHGKTQEKQPDAPTRTSNDTDSDGLAEEGLVYDLLDSSTATKVEPALGDGKGTVFFGEDIALAKGRAERERVLRSFIVCIGKIKIIYRV